VDNNDVADAGPLTDIMPPAVANTIDALHTWLWEALLAAVALHLVAIATYAAAKRHNLLRPMLTGRKRLPARATPPRRASLALAFSILCGSAAMAALLANFL
jgi:cytochrome b